MAEGRSQRDTHPRPLGSFQLGIESLEDRLNPSASPFDPIHVLASDANTSAAAQIPEDVRTLSASMLYQWSNETDFGAAPLEMETAVNQDGRLEVFMIAPNGTVSNRWQTRVNGPWSGWSTMGTNMKSIAVGINADGRLEMFAIGNDRALYHKWQLKPNSGWGGWTRVGGNFKTVEVGTNAQGRQELFLIGNDNALYTRVQTVANGSWGAITKIGGSYQKVQVVRNLTGRLDIFVLGFDGAIQQRSQTSAAGAWGSFVRRDGNLKDFDVTVNQDGRLEIFGISKTNGSIQQRYQTRVGGNYSSWQNMGGNMREIEVTRNSDGRLQIFAINSAGRVVTRWQLVANSRWNATWEDLGAGQEKLRVGQNADGRFALFVTNAQKRIIQRSQVGVAVTKDYSNAWNLDAMRVPEAWSKGATGEGIIVAVLDTGVDLKHEDLAANIWTNPGEVANNGIDDDGNGFVDDVQGWDFANRDNNPLDKAGHGTHVAGIIAALSNRKGSTGIAPFATIMPIQVMKDDGTGSSFDVARGIRYAVDNGARIINISLGGEYNNTGVADAIAYARTKGVFVVAGAGNDSANSPLFPAAYSKTYNNLISVGAHDRDNVQTATTNNVGSSGAIQVDAPGDNIYSTIPGNLYRFMSGTSMATPQVTAIAALVLSANPTLRPDQLRSIIIRTAIERISGSDGRGGVDAQAAVDLALSSEFPIV